MSVIVGSVIFKVIFRHCSGAFIVDFELVNPGWEWIRVICVICIDNTKKIFGERSDSKGEYQLKKRNENINDCCAALF